MRRQPEFDCPSPQASPGPTRPGADTRFRQWVLGLHQLLPAIPGQCKDCSCGSPAVLCPYLRAAHDLLGYPMPWGVPPNRWEPPGPRR